MHYDRKQRHYSVEFFLNSKRGLDIVNFLCNILQRIGAKPVLFKDKRFNSIRVRVRSKEFYNFITESIGNISLNSEEFKIGFISGFIDAEGYVNPKKRFIEIVNTNQKTMKVIRSYLQELKIKANINRRTKSLKDKLPSYRIYVPVKFIKTRNNSIKVQRYVKVLQKAG